jgi:hypothetical protein
MSDPQQYADLPETSQLIRGHELWREGQILNGWHWSTSGEGQGRCSCGERSPSYKTGAARKRWHRRHKTAVLRRST